MVSQRNSEYAHVPGTVIGVVAVIDGALQGIDVPTVDEVTVVPVA